MNLPKEDTKTPPLWLPWLRKLPVGMPGKWRLARFLLRNYLGSQELCIRDKFGFTYLVPSVEEPLGFSLWVDGIYEPDLMKLILRNLKSESVFVDVGANIGTFTLPVSKIVGEKGKVLAIEASPTIFGYLEANVRVNGSQNILLEQCVILDREENAVDFYEAPISHFGMGSLGPQFNVTPIQIRSTTLDHLIRKYQFGHVDLIKADVEGSEGTVFRGAEELLSAARAPMVIFEFSDWAEARFHNGRVGSSQEVLCSFGYEIWKLPDFLKRGKPLKKTVTQGFETLVAVKN